MNRVALGVNHGGGTLTVIFTPALRESESQVALLERESELAEIQRAVDRAGLGDGSLVFLEGPAGIGKSRLLEAACQAADEREMTLLRARGGELEQDFAYGVVRQLLERRLMTASTKEREALQKV